MNGGDFLAIITAAVAAFIISGLWYSPLLFGRQWLALRGINAEAFADKKMPAGTMITEFARTLIIAFVLTHFIVITGTTGVLGALSLAVWIWVGFYAMILVGSVIHDKVSWKLAAIHAGDGLVRIIVMTIIISIWK